MLMQGQFIHKQLIFFPMIILNVTFVRDQLTNP